MPVQLKPNEQLYAQAAAFAYEQPYPHSHELGQKIGEVATALHAGENIVTTNERGNGQIEERTHTPAAYRDFLRRADPETRNDIAFLAGKMQAYAGFQDGVVAALKGATEASSHYLGGGTNGKGFMLRQGDRQFAVKTGGVGYRDVRAFRRGEHVGNISHLEAVDLDHGVAVMNLVPGRLIETMAFAERDAIPLTHLKGVINKAIEMYDAGLIIDPTPGNLLYDREAGFGFIDYHAAGDSTVRFQSKAMQVMNLGETLTHRPYSADEPKYGTPEYEVQSRLHSAEDVSLLNKFLDVLEQGHPDILEEAAANQTEINNDPQTSHSSLVYNTSEMPEGEPFDAFKVRLERRGLQGQELFPLPDERPDPPVTDIEVRISS